jgi:hypothetical protein
MYLQNRFPNYQNLEGSATTVTHEPFSHLQSSEVEERDTEQNLNLAQSTNSSQQEPDEQVEEENSLINSPADEQTLDNDIGQETGFELQTEGLAAETHKPHSLADDDDFINRALQAAMNE